MVFQACLIFHKQFKIGLKEKTAFGYFVHRLSVFYFIKKRIQYAILYVLCQGNLFQRQDSLLK